MFSILIWFEVGVQFVALFVCMTVITNSKDTHSVIVNCLSGLIITHIDCMVGSFYLNVIIRTCDDGIT